MTRYRRSAALALAAALTLPSCRTASGGSASAGRPLAVLTEVIGAVRIARSGGDAEPARPPVGLAEGDRVDVPAGARAVLVCRGDRAATWSGRRVVRRDACAGGVALPRGSFAAVLPGAGRAGTVPGADLPLDRGAARDHLAEYGRVPVVLTPRATTVASQRPPLRWTEVPDADLYVVEWEPGEPPLEVAPSALRCFPDEEFAGVVSCALPWPAARRPLAWGDEYLLRVSARPRDDVDRRASREPNRIRILPEATARRLKQTLADLEAVASQAGETSTILVEGGVLLRYGLASAAVSTYRRAAVLAPSSKVLVTLGDLYRTVRLFRFARETYLEAGRHAATPAERAAVAAGLGHVSFAWGRFDQATAHFAKAESLYSLAGSPDDAAAAARARLACATRRPAPTTGGVR